MPINSQSLSSSLSLSSLYDDFRDPKIIQALAQHINIAAKTLKETLYIMEVCGGHTHSIMKYGLPQLLPDNIRFIHGPGCPVCVMPKERIDQAIIIAKQQSVILVTLGDMLRIAGSQGSLAECRAQGYDVRPVYDPLDALKIARHHPENKVVFFAIGFETSTPMTAALLHQAQIQQIDNLWIHCNHLLVPPAVDQVMDDPQIPVNAFIAPSHVSVIQGSEVYRPLVDRYKTPVVVAGFEPVDVMEAILRIVEQKNSNQITLEVQYRRAVTAQGNIKAQKLIEQYFEVRDQFRWRGLGNIQHSALKIKDEFRHLDAEYHFSDLLCDTEIEDHKACRCAEVLRGLITPNQCKVFAKGCTPQQPLGSCMVSNEGACNAYFRYGRIAINSSTNTNNKIPRRKANTTQEQQHEPQ